jgi:hypothetical protein
VELDAPSEPGSDSREVDLDSHGRPTPAAAARLPSEESHDAAPPSVRSYQDATGTLLLASSRSSQEPCRASTGRESLDPHQLRFFQDLRAEFLGSTQQEIVEEGTAGPEGRGASFRTRWQGGLEASSAAGGHPHAIHGSGAGSLQEVPDAESLEHREALTR